MDGGGEKHGNSGSRDSAFVRSSKSCVLLDRPSR